MSTEKEMKHFGYCAKCAHRITSGLKKNKVGSHFVNMEELIGCKIEPDFQFGENCPLIKTAMGKQMKTKSSLEQERKRLQSEIKEVEDKIDKINKESPNIQLATELHATLCTLNHTDQCSWGYEQWSTINENMHSVRAKYLAMADEILNQTDLDTAMYILNVINNSNILK